MSDYGVRRYRKAVEIEAIQWTGENTAAVRAFTGTHQPDPSRSGNHMVFTIQSGHGQLYVAAHNAWVDLEVGDWIVRHDMGFHHCPPDIFSETYDEVTP